MLLLKEILKKLCTLLLMADIMLVINARSTSLSEGGECRTVEGFQGQCITLMSCPDLYKIYQDLQDNPANSAGAITLLRKSVCKTGTPLLVCCKKRTENFSLPEDSHLRVPEKEVPECGKTTLIQKIVDGEDAQLFEWPWMALIMAKTSLGIAFTCGGALISDRYVLTAAHCTNKNPTNRNMHILYVRVGEYDLSQNPDCKGNTCASRPRDAAVEQIIVHPEYNEAVNCLYCHDIALIKLAGPITPDVLGSFPICLPTNFELQLKMNPTDLQTSNKLASIAGWGSINKNPYHFVRPNILQKAEMPFGGLTEYCRERLKSYQDPSSVFCAGDTGSNSPDSCRGDSGGPIMMKGKNGNNQSAWYVIGIVSRGPTICGARGGQTIFTNVTYYLPWIQENMSR